MCKEINYTQQILNLLEGTIEDKKELYDIVHQCDLKTCDLLHEVELKDIKGMYHSWLILKDLKQIRIIRRKAKDDLQTLQLVENFKISQEQRYKNLIAEISKKEIMLQNRHYNTRTNWKFEIIKSKKIRKRSFILKDLKMQEKEREYSLNSY